MRDTPPARAEQAKSSVRNFTLFFLINHFDRTKAYAIIYRITTFSGEHMDKQVCYLNTLGTSLTADGAVYLFSEADIRPQRVGGKRSFLCGMCGGKG